jgi:hypothetical protein
MTNTSNTIEWNREFAMEQAAYDVELLKELLDILYQTSREELEHIQDAYNEGDAYTIKGKGAFHQRISPQPWHAPTWRSGKAVGRDGIHGNR